MPPNLTNQKVNIGSGNGLIPLNNKSLPEPVLNQIYVTIIPMVSLGHNEFSCNSVTLL